MLNVTDVFTSKFDSVDLSNVGNIDDFKDQYGEPYQFLRRRAHPIGILDHSGFVLKIYHMLRDDVCIEQDLVDNLEDFICSEIDAGNVDRKQGIGFAILGPGFLSISIWGKGNGLFIQTYSVEDTYPHLTRMTLEHTAVACTWDSRIMFHEILAWHAYIVSGMTKSDKLDYLSNFVSGYLDESSCSPKD